jgi:epoxyqueuosine reductase
VLAAALPYGNLPERETVSAEYVSPARLDVFSRRDYYAEAVARLKEIAIAARARFGGRKRDYRIFCNSPVPERPIAAACGLGSIGRNTLVITPEAGSLVVIAAMTLPFELPGDGPLPDEPDPCGGCASCVEACPTGALDAALGGDRRLERAKCIQWYASRPGEVPPDIAAKWGDRLYGCSVCRDVCPHNAKPIPGARTERGALPPAFDARALCEADDQELAALFKGTALGMGWLGPAAIRRNARLAAAGASARS